MLAYLFWHRPAPGADVELYERAQRHFHRSLAHRPPDGFRVSATFRAGSPPWFAGEHCYEDWYVIDDFAALGVLNAAAVAAGHHGAHDDAARHMSAGSAGLYKLQEGGIHLLDTRVSVWVTPARGTPKPILGELLGDGLDPQHAGLWQRQLTLGPAPEYCVLAAQAPIGVSPGRLAPGWSAVQLDRELIGEGS